MRRRRAHTGDTCHRDAVLLNINGKLHSVWRAVDPDGNLRAILVPSRRDQRAAKRFFRQLLQDGQSVPRVRITDTLASYGAAKKGGAQRERRQHKRVNNRAEHAHQPTRPRERVLRRCTSVGHA